MICHDLNLTRDKNALRLQGQLAAFSDVTQESAPFSDVTLEFSDREAVDFGRFPRIPFRRYAGTDT